MELLQVQNLKKVYNTRMGGQQVIALKDVSFEMSKGEFVAVMGASGSGKTTLLNIIASLDKASGGDVILEGKSLKNIKDRELSAFRRLNLGFVFQDFNLLDTFSVKDNILLPLVLSGETIEEMEKRLLPLAEQLGITKLLNKFPYEVSGGEKQRTAMARAVITNPKLILADEPTGALDSKASAKVLGMFEELHVKGQTIMMVTHSSMAASYASRVLFIKDGELFSQLYRGDDSKKDFFDKIVSNLSVLSDGGVDIG
ncbi:bacteriocin ABC transporter ATP-binding protein [Anaerocolumna cellulosilytica]|uniref:Bacteriocin ABC transporter ATP-binding protein n=1 Tax=Anaerocolumna cellulosilytica TaxID=433286 RepID=A0A6S6R8H8_9FIRM|nr:ABC transporter ATP-binding protein [Anaerocolumna cellulosilytica]MBB5197095.1 putative ABC transport system ATP-binding protein [Anaerocolumna cellulosilytica]BCJ95308.1 bacteriocin ABC transporter ATP-binding protein [Anaerocolumna cellulosilytica]